MLQYLKSVGSTKSAPHKVKEAGIPASKVEQIVHQQQLQRWGRPLLLGSIRHERYDYFENELGDETSVPLPGTATGKNLIRFK